MQSVPGAGCLLLCLLPAILGAQAGGEVKPRPPPCQQVRLLLPEAVTALCSGSRHPSLCAAKGDLTCLSPTAPTSSSLHFYLSLSPHLPAPLCSPGFKLFARSLSQLLPISGTFQTNETSSRG